MTVTKVCKEPIWLNIRVNPRYQISEDGHVRRILKNGSFREVKPCPVSGSDDLVIGFWEYEGVKQRKTRSLHLLYAEAFHVSVSAARRIIYEGYSGSVTARGNVKKWLLERIAECEVREHCQNEDLSDEIRYLRGFLKHMNETD